MHTQKLLRLLRLTPALAATALLSASAWAAISVTDTTVEQGGGKTTVKYRLNESATSVNIAVTVGGTTTNYAGPTAKGLNTWQYPTGVAPIGATAVITANGEAVNGAGGAKMLYPIIAPPGRAASITSLAANTRAASPRRGHVYVPTGFLSTAADTKYLTEYAADGTQLKSQNLGTGINGQGVGSGSYPWGIGMSPADTQDRLFLSNRTTSQIVVVNNDLSKGPTLTNTTTNGGSGLGVSPKGPNAASDATYQWNFFQSDNKFGGVNHFRWDTTNTTLTRVPGLNTASEGKGQVNDGGNNRNVQDVAVDVTTTHLYKVTQAEGGDGIRVNTQNAGGQYMNLNHWTSNDDGTTLNLDNNWAAGFVAALGADAGVVAAGGVALDKDFNPSNLAGSAVWVSVSTTLATADPFINRIYKVNAATGAILGMIDLTQVENLEGGPAGVDLTNRSVHFIKVDDAGNLLVTLNLGRAGHGQYAAYFTALAPNSVGPTSQTTAAFALTPGLAGEASVDRARIGNSGAPTATVTYTVNVFNAKGIVADNTTVTGDLTNVGLSASEDIPRVSVGADGMTAVYRKTVSIPAGQPAGAFPITFTVKATSDTTGVISRVNQTIYHALTYDWKLPVSGAVNTSPAANGPTVYVGTNAGNLYAINSATGALETGFGAGGVVNLGEPLKNEIVSNFGKIYVVGQTKVFILRNAVQNNGSPVLASPTVDSPRSVALTPDGQRLLVASGNKILALDPTSGTKIGESADLGAAVYRIAVGTSDQLFDDFLVVAGTDVVTPDGGTPHGQIVMLQASDLTQTFTPLQDTRGAVKSRPVFGVVDIAGSAASVFSVGGASGIWAVNANTGVKLNWTAGSGGGGNVGGNPYLPGAAVDANPTMPRLYSTGNVRTNRILAATRGTADSGGQLVAINVENGERTSYGNMPVTLTAKGTGFAEGAGILDLYNRWKTEPSGESNPLRVSYLGSDEVDQRFFGLQTTPDAINYSSEGRRLQIFDPKDAVTFPGETPGAFNSTPAYGAAKVVVGSAAGIVYGFPLLFADNFQTPIYVTEVTPANGQDAVATTGGTITVKFSSQVEPSTVNGNNVFLYQGSNLIGATYAVPDAAKDTIVITPNSPLASNTWYTVVVSKDVRGANASLLGSVFSSNFYTGTIPSDPRDINGDKVFNIEDVKELLRMVGGLKPATAKAMSAGDLNGSGTLTLEDVLALRRLLP